MKKILLSAAGAAALLMGTAAAEDPWTISGSIAATSNYVWRGITQTLDDPAVQAGVTFAHESGFYAGFWGSNINFGDAEADLEMDLFLGYGGSITEGLTYDLNYTYYAYPGTPGSWNYDFMEFPASLKYSFDAGSVGAKAAYSPAFFGDTGDAFYLGGNVTFALVDCLSVSGNVGKQWLDDDTLNYVHYDFGLTATVENVSFDLRWIATDIDGDDDEVVGTISFAF